MRGTVVTASLIALFPVALAAKPWVEQEDGNWVFQNVVYCEDARGSQRIHYRGIAPADGTASKDLLISAMTKQMSDHQNLRAGTVCKDISRRTRDVDLVYTVNVSETGYRVTIEYVNNGTQFTEYHSWED